MASVLLPVTIQPDASAIIRTGVAGVTIAAGQSVYLDLTVGRLKLADADGSPATAECVGIAINSAVAGQPVQYVTEGLITGLTAIKVGQWYLLSNTPGSISEAAVADVTEDVSFVTFIGIGVSTTSMKLKVFPSGVQLNLA